MRRLIRKITSKSRGSYKAKDDCLQEFIEELERGKRRETYLVW